VVARWEDYLEKWTSAGLIEPSTAERVRAYEAGQEKTQGFRWPVVLAISLGRLLLAAGMLLFVAAHWDALSPAKRFGLILLLVALFHIAGAFAAERFSVPSITLHAVGTICLGAGIFLGGQIFNLQEHWPGGLMLWAIGAWIAYGLLRHWPQAALAAGLTPMWLSGEWLAATSGSIGKDKILAQGLLLLAISYLSGLLPGKETPARRSLAWIGALTLIPAVLFVIVSGTHSYGRQSWPSGIRELGWLAALAPPLGLATVKRGIMTPLSKGLVLAAVHVGLVASLGAKLLYDRATRPRVWALAAPYDPNLPIRGRYVSLQLVVEPRGVRETQQRSASQLPQSIRLHVQGDRLVAEASASQSDYDTSDLHLRFIDRRGEKLAVLAEPVAFFIPEHIPDPSRRPEGEELWVEVTIPNKGPPRPIRLGVKKATVRLFPLDRIVEPLLLLEST
jgi:hypothetical protein